MQLWLVPPAAGKRLTDSALCCSLSQLSQAAVNTTRLSLVQLDGCSLSGNLSSVCGLNKRAGLKQLSLSSNRLNGTIPACLTNSSSLVELRLDGNSLAGSVPTIKAGSPLVYLTLEAQARLLLLRAVCIVSWTQTARLGHARQPQLRTPTRCSAPAENSAAVSAALSWQVIQVLTFTLLAGGLWADRPGAWRQQPGLPNIPGCLRQQLPGACGVWLQAAADCCSRPAAPSQASCTSLCPQTHRADAWYGAGASATAASWRLER